MVFGVDEWESRTNSDLKLFGRWRGRLLPSTFCAVCLAVFGLISERYVTSQLATSDSMRDPEPPAVEVEKQDD